MHARSTPGFIVNRIARPYCAETLALLQEHAATPQAFDACLRAAGFRMGPWELMDLIGHDTNLAVTQSMFEANIFDKRFVPSLVQRELVEGGLFGRKSGQGFFQYPPAPAGPPSSPAQAVARLQAELSVVVHGAGDLAEHLVAALTPLLGKTPHRQPDSRWVGLAVGDGMLVLTDGRTAATAGANRRQPGCQPSASRRSPWPTARAWWWRARWPC